MSVDRLCNAMKEIVDKRIDNEARAKRGTIRNGRFHSGAKSYPFKPATDCKTNEGSKVWAQLSPNGRAVIVGD